MRDEKHTSEDRPEGDDDSADEDSVELSEPVLGKYFEKPSLEDRL